MPKKKTKSVSARSPARKGPGRAKVLPSVAALGADIRRFIEEGRAMRAEDRAESRKLQANIQKFVEEGREMRAEFRALQDGDKKTRQRIEEAEEARGRAAEAMFRGALPAVLEKAGLKVDHVEPRRLRKLDREYDFVARNGKANFVGEVKVRFRAKHLVRLRGLLAAFREDYPAKAGRRAVYGIVCGLVVDEDAAAIARKEGLLVVEGKGAAKLRVKPRKIRDYAGG